MANYIIIPAVLTSTRLPRKLLLDKTGKPLIQHTWEHSLNLPKVKDVIIATDSVEIRDTCENFGARVDFDPKPTTCGTHRVMETASKLKNYNVVVNLQGEWACYYRNDLSKLIENTTDNKPKITSLFWEDDIKNASDIVKVVLDHNNSAIYFSRENIPHQSEKHLYHIGIYAFNKLAIEQTKQCFEKPFKSIMSSENLEQLRLLNYGYKIKMIQAQGFTRGIDTPYDYEEFVDDVLLGDMEIC